MTRSLVLSAISDFLAATYTGPVTIHTETADEILRPPYAVVRVGSAEAIAPGQVEIWDMNVLVAVFHDADATTAETAETQAAEVFAALADPDHLIASTSQKLVWSAWERNGSEASIAENRWQHVAAFRAIVAPAA